MLTVLVHQGGRTRRVDAVDPAWLVPGASERVWVDIEDPDESVRSLLSDTFKLNELAVDDALAEIHHPKIESYDGYLYLILHGIRAGSGQQGFETNDVDFFLGPNYLVTLHFAESRSITQERALCERHPHVLAEGTASLLHRIVDTMVDHYRPEVDTLEMRLEELETKVFEEPRANPVRDILTLKRDVAGLRRVALPQRDAIGRLSRREFVQIPDTLVYRFRDVYDNLVGLTDEAIFLQDRVTGILDAYLSSQSNRMNQVMKVLTVIATIFMPLTVLTGLYGMNVKLPHLPGGDVAQFWWIMGMIAAVSGSMLWMFHRKDWL